jgi:hypothetical protein
MLNSLISSNNVVAVFEVLSERTSLAASSAFCKRKRVLDFSFFGEPQIPKTNNVSHSLAGKVGSHLAVLFNFEIASLRLSAISPTAFVAGSRLEFL